MITIIFVLFMHVLLVHVVVIQAKNKEQNAHVKYNRDLLSLVELAIPVENSGIVILLKSYYQVTEAEYTGILSLYKSCYQVTEVELYRVDLCTAAELSLD